MADFSIKVIADELGKSLDDAVPAIKEQLNQAVQEVAYATHANLIADLQSRSADPKNRQDYLRGLQIQQLHPASWLISLEGDWANRLESGFPAYDMKQALLASKKIVQVGDRAGSPWVRVNKQGGKYAAVPFDHKPFSGEKLSTTGDLASDLKKIRVRNKATGRLNNFTSIFKDKSGAPLQGKVAVASVAGVPNLQNITKYQHTYDKRTSSVYLTFRMISEKSEGWQHPGFEGYQLFREAEAKIEHELRNIVNILL